MKTFFVYLCRLFLFPVAGLFTKEIKGKENIPKENSFIIASNHLNSLDYWFIGNVLKERTRDLRFVATMDSFKTLLQSGFLYYSSGAIVINRKKEKREDIIKKIIKNLENKKIVVLFPEGNTNPRKKLLRGKTGVAELALKSGVPIVPFGIRKAENSLKRIIEMGKPLYFSEERKVLNQTENNQEKYHMFLRDITNKIMQEISKLSQKSYIYDN